MILLLFHLTVDGIPEDVFFGILGVFSQNITEVKLCTKTCSGCEIRANLLLSFLFVFSWGTSCGLVLGLVGGWAFHEHHRNSAHELEIFLVLFWSVCAK
jgi:NhaP-type Na+/H+ or K+/H+ antiporter